MNRFSALSVIYSSMILIQILKWNFEMELEFKVLS